MIIDSHVHLLGKGWTSLAVVKGIGEAIAANMAKTTGERLNPDVVGTQYLEAGFDSTGENLIADMDSAGVDKSCVFATDFGLVGGEPEVGIEEQNSIIAAVAKRFPERIVPFFSIDPRRAGALDMFQQSIDNWGMRGLKLHPTSGYYPNDSITYPFYEKCVHYRIPVVLHQGVIPAPLKMRFAHPFYLDDVAADFPDLEIILAHVAKPFWREALMVAGAKANISMDISGWQGEPPDDFYAMLRTAIDTVGPWRIFFGSDGPYFNMTCPLDRWVRMLTEPELTSYAGLSFSHEEMEIIMGMAFNRLLEPG